VSANFPASNRIPIMHDVLGTNELQTTYRCGEGCELEPPVLLLDGPDPDVFFALRAIALFSSRNTRSNSSGYPGQSRPDFLQLPHVGLSSLHCGTLVLIRVRLAVYWPQAQPQLAVMLDAQLRHTFILRLLHMPHPRLGFPVYTIAIYK
jgi:hypothetical protein